MTDPDDDPQIYEWSDGWVARFELGTEAPRDKYLWFYEPNEAPNLVGIQIMFPGNFARWSNRQTLSPDAQSHILGLLLDLGMKHAYNYGAEMISGLMESWTMGGRPIPKCRIDGPNYGRGKDRNVWYPRFIPDADYARALDPATVEEIVSRYRTDTRHGPLPPEDLLGVLPTFTVSKTTMWKVRWGSNGREMFLHEDLAGIMRAAFETELILPESERSSWEAANIVRGTFTQMSEVEVGMHKMLGEDLPYLWSPTAVAEWLEGRR